jgi:hypothetical protein
LLDTKRFLLLKPQKKMVGGASFTSPQVSQIRARFSKKQGALRGG